MQETVTEMLSQVAKEEYCYLTTKGRVSGRPHEIEIWFGTQGSRLYLMAGDHRSDWVMNLLKDPNVKVRIARHIFTGNAAPVNDETEALSARHLLAEKYQEWDEGRTLSSWAKLALVVGIDFSSVDAIQG